MPTPIPKSLPKHPLHKSITDMMYKIDTPKGPIHVLAYKPDMGPGHAQEIKFLPVPAHPEPGHAEHYHPPPTPTPDYPTPEPVHYVQVKSPHPPPHHVMDYHPPAPKPPPPPPPPPKEYHHPEPPVPHHGYKSLPAELVKQLGAHIKMLHMPEGYGMPHYEPDHPKHYAYDPTAQYAIVVAKPTPKPHPPPPPPPPPPPTYAPAPAPLPPPTPIHYTTPQPDHNIHKKSIQLMQMDENGNLTPLSLYYPPVAHPHSPKPAIRFAEERIDVEEVRFYL
ncbi:MAG: hypothetical protein GY696_23700 [Gammaproteobacteria bacterium]|nr:hypothetical protein [Gammaproteobacteria bacterium]